MSKGRVFSREDRLFRDPRSGRTIRQVTGFPAIHHHPFFFVPAYDRAMRRLVFVSYRTGRPEIFFEERASGRLIQASCRDDFAPWSIHPSGCGRYVLFTAGSRALRLDLETLGEEVLHDFGTRELREQGMVGAAMGTTALSACDRYWAIPYKAGRLSRFLVIDLERGTAEVILEQATIGHPQFCPDDSGLLLYAGPMTDRVWVVGRDGKGHRRVFARRHALQWITHESWIPGRREIAMVDWPHGMLAVQVDSGAVRRITRFPAWHAVADANGRRLVCDTNFPDLGLHLLDARGGSGEASFLCLSEASSRGAHWGGPFPYNDGPVAVDAPQHTHPHPRFAPDGSRVVFTSDRSGHAQIYECLLAGEEA